MFGVRIKAGMGRAAHGMGLSRFSVFSLLKTNPQIQNFRRTLKVLSLATPPHQLSQQLFHVFSFQMSAPTSPADFVPADGFSAPSREDLMWELRVKNGGKPAHSISIPRIYLDQLPTAKVGLKRE